MILKINDRIKVRTVEFFNNFSLNLQYDSIASSFAFNFYFNPNNHDLEELACVSHFHEAIVEHNGEKLVTGYILSEVFNSGSETELVQFAGYSLPGVLEDCQIPPDLYPLQSDGRTLKEIAERLLSAFGLVMIIDSDVTDKMNIVYPKTTANETQSIKEYLTELAAQRNIIISHNENGHVVFTKAKTDQKPIAHFENGVIGTNLSMSFNGQSMHSHITVMKQADSDGGIAGEYTIVNPYVPIVYRPKVIIQDSGEENSLEDAAKNALAAELKNIVLTIKTDRWDIDGKIIKPNTIISAKDPKLYIYKKTNFFIESVSYEGDNEKMTATLKCVPPEVYNGKTPKNIFVDPHKNFATE